MEKKSGMSMQNKLLFYFFLFSAILLALLWLFQIVFIDDFYKVIKRRELATSAKTLIDHLDEEDFSTVAENISYGYGINIRIEENGEVDVFLAHGRFEPMPNRDNQAEGASEGSQLSQRALPPPKENQRAMEVLEYDETVEINGRFIEISLQSIITPVDATISTLKTQLLMVTVIMVLISFVLSMYISKNLSKPIISMNQKAKILGEGNYLVVFQEKGYKEIFELSQTMNQTTRELEKVDLLRKELLSNITHDLRTPLTLIEGYGEAMRDLPGENTPENAQIIIDEAKKLNELITDSIDITSIEKGNKRANKINYNVTQRIAETLEQMKLLHMGKNIKFDFQYTENMYIDGDIAMIDRVFQNLIHNAINYGAAEDQIIIKQELEKDFVRISITDHGMGIEETELPYIWDRYYRTGGDHERSLVGTGLGLSIVKEIMEKHQGNYGVNSEVGKGSSFWFSLPIHTD